MRYKIYTCNYPYGIERGNLEQIVRVKKGIARNERACTHYIVLQALIPECTPVHVDCMYTGIHK